MRRSITTVVAVVTLSVVLAGRTHAQAGKKLLPGAKVQTGAQSQVIEKLPTGGLALLGLQITQFNADRALNRQGLISMRAVVTNTSSEVLRDVTYSLSLKNATGGWTSAQINRSRRNGEADPPVTLVPKAGAIVEAQLPATESAVTFKLDVSGRTQGGSVRRASKQFTLPAKKMVHVVRYSTPSGSWIEVGSFSSGFATDEYLNISQRAQKLQKKMEGAYGFETKRVVKTNTGAFGIGGSNTIRVYVRGSDLTRTFAFDQSSDAKVFQDALHRDVPRIQVTSFMR
jgi:hypothetical protein